VRPVAADPYSSPLAFFGAELKRLRERAGITQGDVAKGTNYALSTVSAYETGKLIPPSDFAKRADKVFGTGGTAGDDEGDLTRLQHLVEQVSVRPWFRDRIEVERKAAEIREYESHQIPGLLQTEDYARAAIAAARPAPSAEELEQMVALRMTRQQILELDGDLPLDQEPMPRLWAIIDESALQRVAGSRQVMEVQLDHLVAMAGQPNVTIQVMPFSQGLTCAYGRAFTILTSRSGSPVVHVEDARSARYLREYEQVMRYTTIFDYLRAGALDDQKSLRLIKGEKQ
jgi:transcriptional regulator with XRE-family HTH domain